MTKTSLEVIQRGFRNLGILDGTENLPGEMHEYAYETLVACFDEVQSVHETAFTWTLETFPDAVFEPFALLLAATVAPHYTKPPPVPRSSAIARICAFAFPDDRTDYRDIDGDGVVSDAEADAGQRALFY